ncbi:hypothetical protein QBC32DRAFT_330785 [Pseudoneurospora amorphoporcata]|uniref:Uncharacterized protein n=1 Tax=Pseudoneurospora amorphoporcata TaxID=241081 RepID=A0AAN6P2F4_9PEZI|nr:hypothetical protein QBC32DRAFT_330785 [Pseudoneurospora amorphoporcata]
MFEKPFRSLFGEERHRVERVSISAAAQLPLKLGDVCVTRPEAPGFSLLCDTIAPYIILVMQP